MELIVTGRGDSNTAVLLLRGGTTDGTLRGDSADGTMLPVEALTDVSGGGRCLLPFVGVVAPPLAPPLPPRGETGGTGGGKIGGGGPDRPLLGVLPDTGCPSTIVPFPSFLSSGSPSPYYAFVASM